MNIAIYFILAFVGLCMGSFAVASVWRLRAGQLSSEEKKSPAESQEYDRLKKIKVKSFLSDRSRCLNCSYVLRWFDMIPLVSWLALGGKCRKCRAKIGYLEPLAELFVALFFVLSYWLWPYELNSSLSIAQFILWLIAGVGLTILFVYDLKWFLLPDLANFFVIAVGLIFSIIAVVLSSDRQVAIASIAGAVVILCGVYFLLYAISRGKWIGFGDVKLGLGLALLLADWRLAFIALFAANLVGCLAVLPFIITKKLHRKSQIPFGPLLIIGLLIAGLLGHRILDMYFLSLI